MMVPALSTKAQNVWKTSVYVYFLLVSQTIIHKTSLHEILVLIEIEAVVCQTSQSAIIIIQGMLHSELPKGCAHDWILRIRRLPIQ